MRPDPPGAGQRLAIVKVRRRGGTRPQRRSPGWWVGSGQAVARDTTYPAAGHRGRGATRDDVTEATAISASAKSTDSSSVTRGTTSISSRGGRETQCKTVLGSLIGGNLGGIAIRARGARMGARPCAGAVNDPAGSRRRLAERGVNQREVPGCAVKEGSGLVDDPHGEATV